MEPRYHSVILDEDKCKGCTNCIKRCPTEAIRVRNGRAFILTERCIDCGECIRICENHAKRAIGDDLDQAISFPYRVALPAPSLYAQFRRELTPKDLNKALIRLGFHEVAEVAAAAELTTVAIREYLKDLDRLPKPMISSACPVVVRLIQMKYPTLIPHLIPVEAPYITAARLAREKVCRERGLRPEEVGLFFLAPCPAKITEVKTDTGQVPLINGVIPISSVYGRHTVGSNRPWPILTRTVLTAGPPPPVWGWAGRGQAARILPWPRRMFWRWMEFTTCWNSWKRLSWNI